MQRIILIFIFSHLLGFAWAQPEPCNPDAMTSTCLEACVVCDIDGFTGTNNLTIQGQTFPGFCTTIYHNMSYIAFIAGTENLTINVSVTNCTINEGVEIGIFESLDCETFTAVTDCNTDVAPNATATFSNLTPLVVGQHYYLILDGSKGDICDWTFNVVEGSTLVGDLTTSGEITGERELCPDLSTSYSTTGVLGATLFYWTLDGVAQSGLESAIDITFPADGSYELCVTAANVCDEAPPTCTTINVVSPEPSFLNETICANDCIEVAGETVCETGLYEYILPLANGCDSTIYLDLIVLPEIASFVDINLCEGETFSIGNLPYASTGIFVETIQTDMGCDSTVTLDLTMIECEIDGNITSSMPTCHGDENGNLVFSIQNGTPPFQYDWSNITNPALFGTGNTDLFTEVTIDNLPAGVYEINVVDNFGDDVVFIQEIINPPVLSISFNAVDFNGYNLSCYHANDGSVSSIGNGGVLPYSFLWNNGETTATISNLSAGMYDVALTDENGCTISDDILLIEPDSLILSASYINPNCEGLETGVIQAATVLGGTSPYFFALDGNEYSTSESFQNLGAGTYNFSVSDTNGCLADTTNSLYEPDIPILYLEEDLEIDLGESIDISATTNNTNLIEINWSDVDNSLECNSCLETNAAPVNSTEYVLTVTSVDDCSVSDSIFIDVIKIRDVFIPNAFSPNNDGVNDYLSIHANKSVALIKDFKVFDRWGGLMYVGTDFTPDDSAFYWDGFFKGELMDNGVYVWVAEVEYLDREIVFMSGDVTLIK